MTNQTASVLTIGRLATQAGVSIDTVRFYEKRGLLAHPQRTAAGYRLYATSVVERLNFIRRAKALGFSLDEISSLLSLQDKGGTKAAVKAIATHKLDEIDKKIDDLERIRGVLRTLSKDCSGTGSIDSCPIIDALGADTEQVT